MFETSWRRNDGASLLHPFETSLWCSNKTSWRRTTETSWRRSIETSLGVSFETYLPRHWDVQRDVAAASPRRLNAGWVATSLLSILKFFLILAENCWKRETKIWLYRTHHFTWKQEFVSYILSMIVATLVVTIMANDYNYVTNCLQ